MEPEVWVHKKSGGLYERLHEAKMQAKDWIDFLDDNGADVDMRDVVVYRSLQDGLIWVRPVEEFNDRFEKQS
jgi:hypothetical protein